MISRIYVVTIISHLKTVFDKLLSKRLVLDEVTLLARRGQSTSRDTLFLAEICKRKTAQSVTAKRGELNASSKAKR